MTVQEVIIELNGVTMRYPTNMIRIIQTLLDTGWIISHVSASQQLLVYVSEKIMYQTGGWYSVISRVGLSQILNISA